jgi:DHA1 family multidrug resistance protein-like MFS transporter
MGLMQTAQSLSGALGPAIGGVVGDVVGFRYAFLGSGVLLAVVTLAVVVFVREPKREHHARHAETFFAGLGYTFQNPQVRKLLVVFFGFHVAYQSIWTFLPLRVQDIVADQSLVGRWSGAAALGDALGIAAGASLIAWLRSRLPLTAGTLVAGVCLTAGASTLLQVLAPWPEALLALRVIVGLCYGGAVVLMRATLGEVADPARRGATFGVAQSAFAGGFAFGALFGSVAIAASGLGAAFLLSAGAFGLVAAWSLSAFPARTS